MKVNGSTALLVTLTGNINGITGNILQNIIFCIQYTIEGE